MYINKTIMGEWNLIHLKLTNTTFRAWIRIEVNDGHECIQYVEYLLELIRKTVALFSTAKDTI